ncbi:MAG: prepilin peptidase [bacterium]
MEKIIWLIAIGIFGLIIGSFLNAIIWRIKVKKTFLRGRSMCPRCKKTLSAGELIPVVSWLVQKGRCRHCHKSISVWYPIVELAMALVFILSWLKFGWTGAFFLDLVVFPFLIIIFVYDAKESLILDRVSLPGFVLALIGNLLLGISFWNLAISAIIGAGFFGLQFIISRGQWIGGGDIRLGLLMGAFLGWPGIFIALIAAYVIGSLVGSGLVIARRKSWQSTIPFGTFLTGATIIVHLYGDSAIPYFT